jgi:hypothetical protein
MLAFKSDVSHWRKKDELTGVSVRTVCFYILLGTLHMPNSLYDADHHERFRAIRDFIVSH